MKSIKRIVALMLVCLMVIICGISAVAVAEESYFSGNIVSANQYLGGEITILTRAETNDGILTKIADTSGHFLAVDGGKDYNYFVLLVCAPDENDDYRITETYFTLGRPDGIKADVEIPENGFIIGINGERTDDVAAVKDIAVVGDYVTLTGVDLGEIEIADSFIASLSGASFTIAHDDGTIPAESVVESATESTTESSVAETPDTGDSFAIFAIIAILALSGAAVVSKARN
ncbi:MAG: hypothetical protein A2Y17_09020 [Clostridiales bacterium GWF2_38_85]|nr:MAG: hypothetical protein A2Y17_09020 [Clostridiales bacterium GWF2_38_85]HBL83662.1 hypothetical protein [Clostridiales bacterium]